jgi:hypothetical protein
MEQNDSTKAMIVNINVKKTKVFQQVLRLRDSVHDFDVLKLIVKSGSVMDCVVV